MFKMVSKGGGQELHSRYEAILSPCPTVSVLSFTLPSSTLLQIVQLNESCLFFVCDLSLWEDSGPISPVNCIAGNLPYLDNSLGYEKVSNFHKVKWICFSFVVCALVSCLRIHC